MHNGHTHERRFGGGAERLRAAERVALLEVPRVIELTFGGLTIASALDVGTGTGIFAEAFSASGLATSAIAFARTSSLLAPRRPAFSGSRAWSFRTWPTSASRADAIARNQHTREGGARRRRGVMLGLARRIVRRL